MSVSAARPWIIMALIFILGGVTGSFLTVGLGPHFEHGPGPQEIRNHWMQHLSWKLHLTQDQITKIEPIITDAETNIQQAHRDDVARISGIIQKANASIRPLLNAEQQAELAEMDKERERMFDGHMHGGMGHHGPFGGAEDEHAPGPPPSD